MPNTSNDSVFREPEMKRTRGFFLIVYMFAAMLIILTGCGGGGGNGPGLIELQDEIALFADDSYVKYTPGSSTAEASNLEAALRAMGHTVTPFTGITAADFQNALSGRKILVIPELEQGNLYDDMDTAGRTVLSDFVTDGGTLFVFNDSSPAGTSNNITLINGLFGHSISAPVATVVGAISRNDVEAAGTAFEDSCPAALDTVATVKVLLSGTLPVETRSIYTDVADNTALALLPEGSGRVAILGWDWQGARPVGTQDGGWWSVLYRAVSSQAILPEVALVSDDTGSAEDVVEKLKASGKFSLIDTIDAATATPRLSRILAYDAVIVFSGFGPGFADTTDLGDVMANYVDQGGGLVTAYTALVGDKFLPDFALGGRYLSGQYNLIPSVDFTALDSQSAAAPGYGDHPVLAGYLSFYGGTNSARADTTVVLEGATQILQWNDGVPLVVTGEVSGVHRVDLNFFPPSSDFLTDLWDTSTDGDKLMANALTWAANLATYPYDSFSGTISSPAIPDGGATIFSTVTVSGGPNSISQVKVTVDISHTANHDLDISIRSPGGTTVDMSTDNGGAGNNYAGVTFDDAAGRAAGSFAGMVHNFSGDYIPEQSLAAFIGMDSNGTWTLQVIDDLADEEGTLNSWMLHVR